LFYFVRDTIHNKSFKNGLPVIYEKYHLELLIFINIFCMPKYKIRRLEFESQKEQSFCDKGKHLILCPQFFMSMCVYNK
jgi:hypothetical protein